jgi:hypothetical protein
VAAIEHSTKLKDSQKHIVFLSICQENVRDLDECFQQQMVKNYTCLFVKITYQISEESERKLKNQRKSPTISFLTDF